MRIMISLSGADGCADYSHDLADLRKQVFKEKSLYSCSFYPVRTGAGSMLDSYRGGHVSLELQVRGWILAGDPCDFGAIYQVDVGTLKMMVSGDQPRSLNLNLERDGPLQHNLDQPVLVGVIEVSKDGKERWHGGTRSLVRLDALDSVSDRLAEIRDAPVFRPKVIGCVVDEKCGPSLIRRWIRLQVVNGDRIDEVVERGSQIVNSVPKDQGPSLERWRLQNREDDAVTCAVAIDLQGDCVRVFLYPGIKFLIDKASVFVRPLDLRKNAVETQHEGRVYALNER